MATAPISLYFGVEPGKRADLETIALASLEWANLIRDIATVIAPDIEFEIEFVESKEGSVWLSNLLTAVREGDRKALGAIVSAVLVFFAMGPALHLQTDFGDWLLEQLGHEHTVDLSEEDKEEIVNRIVQAIDETQMEDRRRKIVEIAERDAEVRSIGVDVRPRVAGPITKISREQFPAYYALPPAPKVTEQDKGDVIYERNIDVKIVRASLREGERKPRWRFRQGESEWSATIADEGFIWAINEEKTGLPLAAGQHMRVDVAIDLKLNENNEWVPKDRRVVRVHEPRVRRAQAEFELGSE